MPQSDCLITAVAPSVPSPVMATPKLSGRVVPWSVRSPSTRRLSPSACTDFDSKLISSPFSTSLSTVCSISVFCASLSAWTPPLAFLHAQRPAVGADLDHRVGRVIAHDQHGFPGGHVEQQVVARHGGRPGPLCADGERAVIRPERVSASRNCHCQRLSAGLDGVPARAVP